jgi:pilus assembly protein TadC
MAIYERLSGFGETIPLLSNIAQRGDRDELDRAVVFLQPLMKTSRVGVVSSAYFVGLVVFLLMASSSCLLQLSLLFALPLSSILAIVFYYIIVSYPVSKMNSYKLSLAEEADLLFEQFILVFQSGGTIFDAISLVAESDHPYLSSAFKSILKKAAEGRPPEESLMEFAKHQPSEDVRRYIIAVISALERKTDLLDELSGQSFEADMTLRSKNLELESRLLVVAALVTYVPILLTLSLSLLGTATDPVVLVFAPLFIALNGFLRIRFTSGYAAYFDRPQKMGPSPPSQREIMEEYDDFLNFMVLLGERLNTGDTLEVALVEVRDDSSSRIQPLLDSTIKTVSWESKGIEEAMNEAADYARGQRVANMYRMIPRMCEYSATEAGNRLSRIASRLIVRSAVLRERESIIQAQRFKVYLLSITSSIVLGLLSSLAPYLYIGSLLSEGPSWTPGSVTLMDMFPLALLLIITSLSSGYQNSRMVGGKRSKLFGLVCAVLYWLALIASSNLLGL